MIVGTSQIGITPQPGIELAGFAIRPQPSTSVLDRLSVRGLYLEDGPERLLWLHADLIALELLLSTNTPPACSTADANGDGALTQDDLQAAIKSLFDPGP